MVNRRIKQVRKALKLTQIQMAEKLNLSHPSYNRYETSKQKISEEALKLLLQLGVNVNWLLDGQGEMFLSESSERSPPQEKSDEKDKIIAELKAQLATSQFSTTHTAHSDPMVAAFAEANKALTLAMNRQKASRAHEMVKSVLDDDEPSDNSMQLKDTGQEQETA